MIGLTEIKLKFITPFSVMEKTLIKNKNYILEIFPRV